MAKDRSDDSAGGIPARGGDDADTPIRLGPFHYVQVDAKRQVVTLYTAAAPVGAGRDALEAHRHGEDAWTRIMAFWSAQGYSIRKQSLPGAPSPD